MDNHCHTIGSTLFPSQIQIQTQTQTTNFLSTSDDESHPPTPTATTKWHRMKWTDEIVRLLIHLVSYVSPTPDDVIPDPHHHPSLQKKGKWKTISKLMQENHFHVSPQQCEDKFNDLNKRYKRLNEILGRSTTCQVVENPALLDSMHHVSAKAKEDVRKILSSKHLFYREMCAYHNGQSICSSNVHDGFKDDDDDDDDVDVSDEEDEKVLETENLGAKIVGMDVRQKREYLRKRSFELLEERVEIESEGVELEKRRSKWEMFKSKKDWEIEKARMENERLRLENEMMVLQVRRMEMELEAGDQI